VTVWWYRLAISWYIFSILYWEQLCCRQFPENRFWRSADITPSKPGVLNLIFFHRYFPSIRPTTFDVLDFTLPAIDDVELETLIESRISALVRQHTSATSTHEGGGGVRGRIAVEFYEKKRKRSGAWFSGLAGKGEEEVCWEVWNLDVTIATPRTESGTYLIHLTNPMSLLHERGRGSMGWLFPV
jgi:hypothetical protein